MSKKSSTLQVTVKTSEESRSFGLSVNSTPIRIFNEQISKEIPVLTLSLTAEGEMLCEIKDVKTEEKDAQLKKFLKAKL